jgi:uncharacterized protein DUF5522
MTPEQPSKRAASARFGAQDDLVEEIDYYMENGFMVFTATYLQKRGFCCQSGCRHCPYGFVRDRDLSNREPS